MQTYTTIVPLSVAGTLSTSSVTPIFALPRGADLVRISANVGTAPTGAALLLNVKKNGTDVYSGASRDLQIAISGTKVVVNPAKDAASGVNTITPAITPTLPIATFAAGDTVQVTVDQVGSTVAGANLAVFLEFSVK